MLIIATLYTLTTPTNDLTHQRPRQRGPLNSVPTLFCGQYTEKNGRRPARLELAIGSAVEKKRKNINFLGADLINRIRRILGLNERWG